MVLFYLILLISVVALLGVLFVISRYFSLWLQALVSGSHIRMLSLISMSLRNVDPAIVVRAVVMADRARLRGVSANAVEAQYLAGGDVHRVVLSLIAAHRAGITLDWNTAAAIDLAGRDILEAVQVSVNPKVIFCPSPEAGGRETLDGVAKDGIQLKVRALVTVRANLAQLVGGATESTIIARVGQGIVSAIGACDSYHDALSDPAMISRNVILKGLDSQTSFAIVSIDIAAIQVGTNVGAQLQLQQAEADVRIARATAEKRRAMALARQQEMQALTKEYEALVVLAEAQIPSAIAAAFRDGQLHSRPTRRDYQPPRLRIHPELKSHSRPTEASGKSSAARVLEAWETEGGASFPSLPFRG